MVGRIEGLLSNVTLKKNRNAKQHLEFSKIVKKMEMEMKSWKMWRLVGFLCCHCENIVFKYIILLMKMAINSHIGNDD